MRLASCSFFSGLPSFSASFDVGCGLTDEASFPSLREEDALERVRTNTVQKRLHEFSSVIIARIVIVVHGATFERELVISRLSSSLFIESRYP